MNILRKQILITCMTVLFLTGCVGSMTSSNLDIPPLTTDFGSMPIDAATITSAVAIQAATPPLQKIGLVTFAYGATTSLAMQLGAEKFGFTGAKLFSHTPAIGANPGLAAAEIEYTDALDRKATVLYRAEFTKDGDQYTVTKLNIDRYYKDRPRVQVTVVPSKDLLKTPVKNYTQLIAFLADKGLSPRELANSGKQEYAVFAVGKDWANPKAKMAVAISAKKTGSAGYKKSSNAYSINGWPAAVTIGTLDPSSTKNKLYAKVSFKQGDGFTNISRSLGTYQLSGFDK